MDRGSLSSSFQSKPSIQLIAYNYGIHVCMSDANAYENHRVEKSSECRRYSTRQRKKQILTVLKHRLVSGLVIASLVYVI